MSTDDTVAIVGGPACATSRWPHCRTCCQCPAQYHSIVPHAAPGAPHL